MVQSCRSIQYFAQSLHFIEQNITLPDNCLILGILEWGPSGLYDAIDFVNRTVEAPICNKPGELTEQSDKMVPEEKTELHKLINEINAYSKCRTKAFKC